MARRPVEKRLPGRMEVGALSGMRRTERLDKMLARAGFGSRSDVRKLVRAGRVYVDGVPAFDAGMKIDLDRDDVRVDGERVVFREFVYLMMNKPPGVVSATEDRREATVVDLLAPEYRRFGVFPVGRLDKDAVGLLLLTNDGKLAHELLSPRRHVPKTYLVETDGALTEGDAEAFARGVRLDDGYVALPAELRLLDSSDCFRAEVTVVEGKFHQIKRMFQAIGRRVTFLERVRFGPLELDRSLARGAYRELTEREIALLRTPRPQRTG